MKISVIVPVFNVEDYIDECLNSISNQVSDDELECVLVDDCGCDNSMALVEEYIKAYRGNIDFKVIHHDHNRGLSAARNTGMDVATGDYIFFLDSDDMIKNDCIISFREFIKANGEFDFVICGIETLGGVEKDCPKINDNLSKVVSGEEILKKLVKFDWFVLAQSKFYRKAFLIENYMRFVEGLIHEDNLWTYQLACVANKMGVIKEKKYVYRIHEGSIMTSTKAQKRIDSILFIINEVVKSIKNDERFKAEKYDYIRALTNTIATVCTESMTPSDTFVTYKKLREIVSVNLFFLISVYRFNFKKICKDCHYTIPVSLGYHIYQLMHK